MPILGLNELGEVVETDSRYNGSQGVGRVAEFAEAGDVQQLSNSYSPEEIKIREKMVQAELLKFAVNLKKKYLAQVDHKVREKIKEKRETQRYFKSKKMADKILLAKNIDKLKQISSGYAPDIMSGVSGYGLSADGRLPDLSRPAYDYTQPVAEEVTDKAFGDWPEEGYSFHDLKNNMVEQKYGPNDFTSEDAYILRTWEDNLYAPKYRYQNYPKVYNLTFDDNNKSGINGHNQSNHGSSYVSKMAQQGWMWSGWWNEQGEWVKVKVPFSFGLPMDNPDMSSTYTKAMRDNWTKYVYYSDPYYFNRDGKKYKMAIFNFLRPVIEAYAKKFYADPGKYGHAVEKPPAPLPVVTQENNIVATQPARQAQTALKLKVNPQLVHPMIKYNLLK